MAIITCSDPQLTTVQAAVNLATYQDTVIVPAGAATWSSPVTSSKGISIIAAGAGQTIITQTAGAFSFTPDATQRANGYLVRWSGFTLGGSGGPVFSLVEPSANTVPTRNIRIDSNAFTASGSYPIYVQGNFWGVVDSNDFSGSLAFEFFGNDTEAAFIAFYPVSYGTADNLYFEDNTFRGSSQLYMNSGHGGRYSFRHNAFNCSYMGNPLFDQHGNQGGGIMALMLCEIYENAFTGFTTGVARWDYQRGGKLLLYNNALSGSGGSPNITINDDVADPDQYIQYPYDDYIWNNTWNGTRIPATQGVTQNDPTVGVEPTENIQFFNQNDNFNGTSGMGVGLLSARPASCSLLGAGWWATDTQTLYVWNGTAWTVKFTPYIYPHPLRSSGMSTQTVNFTLTVTTPPGWFLAINPSALSVAQGTPGSFAVTATAQGGYSGSIALSVLGLPTGVAATISPASIAQNGTATITIPTTALPVGAYALQLQGVSAP